MAVQDIMIVKFKEMESNGKLEIVESCPWVSKILILPKPNGDIRICIAHPEVIKGIIRDKDPLSTQKSF